MENKLRKLAFGSVLLLAACNSASSETAQTEAEHSEPAPAVAKAAGSQFSVAGFEFTAPAEWVAVAPTSSMRKASFEYGPVEGDAEKAELHVFFFGAEQGGGVEDNIQRWLGQVTMEEGVEAERETTEAAGYPIHFVRASGSYALSMGGPMSGQSEQKPGWRLVGAIVEGAQGNVFFRIAGPEATVRAMEPGLRTMLEGLSMGRE